MIVEKNVSTGTKIRKIAATLVILLASIGLIGCIWIGIRPNFQESLAVKIKPILGSGTVSFRGAIIDEIWYDPSTLIQTYDGWVRSEDGVIYTASGNKAMELLLPAGQERILVFDVSTTGGKVIMCMKGKITIFDLHDEIDHLYGLHFKLTERDRFDLGTLYNYNAAVTIGLITLIMLAFILGWTKPKAPGHVKKTPRNAAVEFMRFYMIMGVTLHHYGGRASGGYLGVDFFFTLSGFLLMQNFMSRGIGNNTPIQAAGKYVKQRYLKLLPYYLFAVTLVYILGLVKHAAVPPIYLLENTIWELLMVEGFGFTTNLMVGPGWFCSALLICSFAVYFLLAKDHEVYIRYIAPLSALLIFGYMGHKVGSLNYWLKFEENTIISIAILRGFAEMGMGCICWYLAEQLRNQVLGKKHQYLSALIECICIIGITYAINHGNTRFDILAEILMTVLIGSLFLGNSFLYKLLNNRLSGYLGKISVGIYLTHHTLTMISWLALIPLSWEEVLGIYQIIVIVFAAISTEFVNRVSNAKALNRSKQ